MATIQQINEEIDRIGNAKTEIGEAIQGKGVEVPAGTPIQGYPALVRAIPTPVDAIFWAEYGTTTAQEIRNAISAGKICKCNYNGRQYTYCADLVGSTTYNYLWFESRQNNQGWYIRVRTDNNQWSANYQNFENSENRVSVIEGNESSTTKYPNTKAVSDALSSLLTLLSGYINDLTGIVNGISALIPAQASEQNKLADKNFVNSSIATNTANYISDNGEPFTSVADLEAYSGLLTNNDYAFVVGTDAAGNTTYTRYKYNANTQQWAEEYVLNNSSFTAAQWAAISSGITALLVSKLEDLPAANDIVKISELATQLGQSATKALTQKAVTDALALKQNLIDAQNKLDYSLIDNTPTIPTTYAGSPNANGPAFKAMAMPFGQVDSTSTATEMTATVDNFPSELRAGVFAYIKNGVISSASGFTLDINGTGALPVYQTMAAATRVSSLFNINYTMLFIYNPDRVEGGCWDMFYGYNSDTNTIAYQIRKFNSNLIPFKYKTYRYRLMFLAPDGSGLIPSNTSTSTSATASKPVITDKINPFGLIFYYSSTATINAGDGASSSYLWEQYTGITLGYAFNVTGAAWNMTPGNLVYLKCTPQTDGMAIIDSTTPIVFALPTNADGFIYIYLGIVTEATKIEMHIQHPVYYHNGTGIRLWHGQ